MSFDDDARDIRRRADLRTVDHWSNRRRRNLRAHGATPAASNIHTFAPRQYRRTELRLTILRFAERQFRRGRCHPGAGGFHASRNGIFISKYQYNGIHIPSAEGDGRTTPGGPAPATRCMRTKTGPGEVPRLPFRGRAVSDVGSVMTSVVKDMGPFIADGVHFLRTRRRLCRTVRQPRVHPHPAGRPGRGRGRAARHRLAHHRRQCRDHGLCVARHRARHDEMAVPADAGQAYKDEGDDALRDIRFTVDTGHDRGGLRTSWTRQCSPKISRARTVEGRGSLRSARPESRQ
jgi:hypothetical protein